MIRCETSHMKTRSLLLTTGLCQLLVGFAWYLLLPSARALDGTWTDITAGPNIWSSSAFWSGGVVADDAGFTANFTSNITATTRVTLDSNRNITNLNFSDNGANGSAWILNASGGSVLTLGDGVTPGISTITNVTTTTISAVLAGVNRLVKAGDRGLFLTGVNTYSGGTTVNSFYLGINSDASLGAVPDAFVADNIILNGGTLSSFTGSYNSGIVLNANRGLVLGASGGTLDGGSSGIDMTIQGVISGTGTLTRATGGTIVLTAPNTYSGATRINAGTLSVASVGDAGSTTSNLGTNATIRLGSGTSTGTLLYTGSGETSNRVLDLGGAVGGGTITQSGTGLLKFASNLTATGAGSKALTLQGSTEGTGEIAGAIVNNSGTNTTRLVKAGTGTWTLSGANTYTGTTTLNASGGTLLFANQTSLYNNNTASWTAANLIVNTGSTLAFNVGGPGEFTTSDVTTLISNLNGAVSSNGLLSGSRIGFDTTNAGSSFTISNVIANTTGTGGGAVGLVKLGTGTLELTSASTFTGPLIIAGGVLRIGTGGQLAVSGAYAGVVTNNGTLELASGSAQTLSGGISGSGAVLKSAGTGNVLISGTNTYSGSTTVNAGTLTLTGSNASSGFTIGAGATMALRTITLTSTQNITGAGNLTKDITTFGNSSIAGTNNNYTGTTVVNISTFTLASGGVINGTSSVTVLGQFNAQLQNNGSITTAGAVAVNGYTNASASTPAASGVFFNGNIAGTTPGVLNATSLTLGSSFLSGANAAHGGEFNNHTNSTANFGSGAITINGQGASGAGGMVAAGSNFANAGSVTAGSLTLNSSSTANTAANKGGSYSQTAGSSAFSGTVTLAANGGVGAVGTAGNDAALSLSGGTFIAATIAVNSGSLVLTGGTLNLGAGGITSTGANAIQVSLGSGTVGATTAWSSSVAAALTDAATGTVFDTTGGNIELSGVLSGSGNLIKSGTGALTLSGVNTHFGTTTVSEGALALTSTGSTGTGAVTVQTGSTILGTGLIQGSSFVAQSGASVYAGVDTSDPSFGTLEFTPASGSASFDFQSGSTIILGLNPSGTGDLLSFDGLSNGTLNFNGLLTITAPNFVPMTAQTFQLLSWVNLTSINFDSRFHSSSYSGLLFGNGDDNLGFDLPDISTSGFGWDISHFASAGSISTMIIPEPSRTLLCLLGCGLLILRRRR